MNIKKIFIVFLILIYLQSISASAGVVPGTIKIKTLTLTRKDCVLHPKNRQNKKEVWSRNSDVNTTCVEGDTRNIPDPCDNNDEDDANNCTEDTCDNCSTINNDLVSYDTYTDENNVTKNATDFFDPFSGGKSYIKEGYKLLKGDQNKYFEFDDGAYVGTEGFENDGSEKCGTYQNKKIKKSNDPSSCKTEVDYTTFLAQPSSVLSQTEFQPSLINEVHALDLENRYAAKGDKIHLFVRVAKQDDSITEPSIDGPTKGVFDIFASDLPEDMGKGPWCNTLKFIGLPPYDTDYDYVPKENGGCEKYREVSGQSEGEKGDLFKDLKIKIEDDESGIQLVTVSLGKCTYTYNASVDVTNGTENLSNILNSVSTEVSRKLDPGNGVKDEFVSGFTIPYSGTFTPDGIKEENHKSLLDAFKDKGFIENRLDECLSPGLNYLTVYVRDMARSYEDGVSSASMVSKTQWGPIKVDNGDPVLKANGSLSFTGQTNDGGDTIWHNKSLTGSFMISDKNDIIDRTKECEHYLPTGNKGTCSGPLPTGGTFISPFGVDGNSGEFDTYSCELSDGNILTIPKEDDCVIGCSSGKVYDSNENKCIDPLTDCPSDTVYDENLKICKAECDGGSEYYIKSTNTCISKMDPSCKEYDEITQECIVITDEEKEKKEKIEKAKVCENLVQGGLLYNIEKDFPSSWLDVSNDPDNDFNKQIISNSECLPYCSIGHSINCIIKE